MHSQQREDPRVKSSLGRPCDWVWLHQHAALSAARSLAALVKSLGSIDSGTWSCVGTFRRAQRGRDARLA